MLELVNIRTKITQIREVQRNGKERFHSPTTYYKRRAEKIHFVIRTQRLFFKKIAFYGRNISSPTLFPSLVIGMWTTNLWISFRVISAHNRIAPNPQHTWIEQRSNASHVQVVLPMLEYTVTLLRYSRGFVRSNVRH